MIRAKKDLSLKTGERLKPGDRLITGTNGAFQLVDEESEIHVAERSELQVHSLVSDNQDQGRFDIVSGSARVRFKTPSGPEAFPYTVKVGSVIASVQGTEFYVANEKGEQRVATLEGLVRVTSTRSASELWDVPEGKGLHVKPGEMPKVKETTTEQVTAWKKATEL